MPRRRSKPPPGSPRAVFFLAAFALFLFLGGEALLLMRTDSGRLTVARYLRIGNPELIEELLSKHIQGGLEASGVPAESLSVSRDSRPLRYRVGVQPAASLLQINHAITTRVDEQGGTVLSGREEAGENGSMVTLEIGLGDRVTHVVELRQGDAQVSTPAAGGRLALLLYGFSDNVELAERFFSLPVPFAVALPAGADRSADLLRAARRNDRELVLHLPLEPLNYPQSNPGPGTLLVTMPPSRITSQVRRYLDQAGTVSAVANLAGSLATQDVALMKAVYEELRRRRITFLHVSPVVGSVCQSLATDLGVAYDEPDFLIDAEARADETRALSRRWSQALERAREAGTALVMLRATETVLGWLPSGLSARRLEGVELVPVSTVLKQPSSL